jgi:hypothetical protein
MKGSFGELSVLHDPTHDLGPPHSRAEAQVQPESSDAPFTLQGQSRAIHLRPYNTEALHRSSAAVSLLTTGVYGPWHFSVLAHPDCYTLSAALAAAVLLVL